MQSNTNNSPTHVSLMVGGSSMVALGAVVGVPNTALGLTLDEATSTLTSSPVPLMCAGAGFVVGAGCMAAVAHAKHKHEIQDLEERLSELEDQLGKANSVIAASRKSALSRSRRRKRVDKKASRGSTASNANTVVEPDENASSSENVVGRRHRGISEALNSLPVIERGETAKSNNDSTDRIDLAHFKEVTRRLDGQTRARMIERRIPKLTSLIEPSVNVTAIDEEKFFDSKNFDPSTYVDRIMQEELQRNRSGAARRYSLSQLTVIEGRNTPTQPKARHMASLSKEA